MDFTCIPGLGTFWDIVKNVLSNRIDAALFSNDPPSAAVEGRPTEAATALDSTHRAFRTFDTVHEFAAVLALVHQPAVHLLIETEPSTFYNLAALVLECQSTGQWYLFSRGRIALQGGGGGHKNMEDLVGRLRGRGTSIAAWVLDRGKMDEFELGLHMWSDIKKELIPLVAHFSEDDVWAGMKIRFRELAGGAGLLAR